MSRKSDKLAIPVPPMRTKKENEIFFLRRKNTNQSWRRSQVRAAVLNQRWAQPDRPQGLLCVAPYQGQGTGLTPHTEHPDRPAMEFKTKLQERHESSVPPSGTPLRPRSPARPGSCQPQRAAGEPGDQHTPAGTGRCHAEHRAVSRAGTGSALPGKQWATEPPGSESLRVQERR